MRPELISQPITGICSFGRYPICLDLDRLDADFGVLGVPFDMGVGFLSGARMGPRRIRRPPHSMDAEPRDITTTKPMSRCWRLRLPLPTAAMPTCCRGTGIILSTALSGGPPYNPCRHDSHRHWWRSLHQHSGWPGPGGVPQRDLRHSI